MLPEIAEVDWQAKVLQMSAFDLETYLIERGILAPRIVCGSSASIDVVTGQIRGELLDKAAAAARAKEILRTGKVIVGANIAYDLACLVVYDPDFLELIFKAFDEERVYDVQIAMALDAIAWGLLYIDPRTSMPLRDPDTGKQARYNLAVCVDLCLGRKDAKRNDDWRKRYGELDGVPIADYPPEAAQYPVDDAENTLGVAVAQVLGGGSGVKGGSPLRNLGDLPAQVETAFGLHLGAIWGMRVDQEKVRALRTKTEAAHKVYLERFTEAGFFKADKKTGEVKEDGATVKRAVIFAYDPEAGPCPDSVRGVGRFANLDVDGGGAGNCRDGKVLSPKTGKPINCKTCSGTGLNLANAPRTPTGGVRADRDALAESGSDILMAFGDNEAEKILQTYLPKFESEEIGLALRPNVIVATGRTSYDGLIQLLPQKGGLRDCCRARGAWCGCPVEYVFCSVDYGALELCTFSQVARWLFGRSVMADTINATGDPGSLHTAFAAALCGCTAEEMKVRLKAGDPVAKAYRQVAKFCNFALLGGMGAAKFCLLARKKNAGETTLADGSKVPGIRFCVMIGGRPRCGERRTTRFKDRDIPPTCVECLEIADKQLRPAWFKQWDEVRPYFDWVTRRVDMGGEFGCWGTARVRGGLDFTNGANNSFQALASDGAKYALRKLVRECYGNRDSVLWGTRPIFFVHDEIIAEIPRRNMAAAGDRMAEVMVAAMREYVPDVTIKADPTLMEYWYKEAEMVRDANGVLGIWQPGMKS